MNPKMLDNGIWVLDGDTHISKWVIESGRLDHDRYMVPIIEGLIQSGDHVIDGGAYIGDHTIAYQNAVGPTGRVVAVEPNKAAFRCLAQNVPDAKLLNSFIGSEDGDSAFMDIDTNNVGASRVADSDSDNIDYMVKSVTIDTITGALLDGKCNLIKLDLEGYEVFALEGAKRTISICRPFLVIEINRGALQRHGFDYETIFAALHSYGYFFNKYPNCLDTDPQYDIIAIPNEKRSR